ncbi:UXP [Human mastadenovirus D]|nr:UXP [Human mastadenovirus D]
MKIVDQEFDIPFKVWRKFAARRGLEYQSWEEGTEVLLNNYTRDILSDFKAFAARVSSRPSPSKILGTSSREAISGNNGRRQSGRAPVHGPRGHSAPGPRVGALSAGAGEEPLAAATSSAHQAPKVSAGGLRVFRGGRGPRGQPSKKEASQKDQACDQGRPRRRDAPGRRRDRGSGIQPAAGSVEGRKGRKTHRRARDPRYPERAQPPESASGLVLGEGHGYHERADGTLPRRQRPARCLQAHARADRDLPENVSDMDERGGPRPATDLQHQ